MCYHMIPLASHDDHHFIGQCEHGTLHLTWGRVMLSLHPDELLLIALTLRRYNLESRADISRPGIVLLWYDQDTAQLWLARAGLLLDAEMLAILLQLIADTSKCIVGEPTALFNQHDLIRVAHYQRADPSN